MDDAARARSLARLQRVYSLLADQRMAELKQAKRAEASTLEMQVSHRENARLAYTDARRRRLSPQHTEASFDEIAGTFHVRAAASLTSVLQTQQTKTETCGEAYQTVARQRDRVGYALEHLTAQLKLAKDRHDQAIADDRHLGRRIWQQGKPASDAQLRNY